MHFDPREPLLTLDLPRILAEGGDKISELCPRKIEFARMGQIRFQDAMPQCGQGRTVSSFLPSQDYSLAGIWFLKDDRLADYFVRRCRRFSQIFYKLLLQPKLSAGATQIDGPIHVFGVSSAPAYYGGATSASPAVWFNTSTASRCWGGPWYVETSDIGMKIDSNANVLGPIYSHHCMYGNIQVLGSYNTIRDFEITPIAETNWLEEGTVDGVGASTIQLDTENTFVSGGLIGLRVVITSGTGAGQSRNITAYDGPSDTATVSPPWDIQPPVGSAYVIRQAPAIDIAAQENTVLNGRIGSGGFVRDGITAIRIKGTNAGQRQVIRDVIFFGTANSSVPLISVEETLDDSVIVAKCFHAGTFLDLYTSSINRIGTGNYIWLTTAGNVTKAVNLPPNWNDLANEIWVDGVLQTSPILTLIVQPGSQTITITQRNHMVDTNAVPGSGLKTINGGAVGQTIVLRAASSDRNIELFDAATGGNLELNGNFLLNNAEDSISLYYDGSNWIEISRSDNGA